jgi:hypothetical protein
MLRELLRYDVLLGGLKRNTLNRAHSTPRSRTSCTRASRAACRGWRSRIGDHAFPSRAGAGVVVSSVRELGAELERGRLTVEANIASIVELHEALVAPSRLAVGS